MNASAIERKVILKKVAESTYTPLEGAQFRIFRADLSEVINSDYDTTDKCYKSLASGVYFIDTLPEGKYYLVETGAPTKSGGEATTSYGGNVGKVFTLEIKDGMVRQVETTETITIPTASNPTPTLEDNLRALVAYRPASTTQTEGSTDTTTP